MIVKLELNKAELQGMLGLIDAGLKSVGIRGAKDAGIIITLVEAAVAVADELEFRKKPETNKKKK